MRNEEVVKACLGFLTSVNTIYIWVFDDTETDINIVAKDVLVTVHVNPEILVVQAPTVGVTSDGKYTSMKLPETRLFEVLKLNL